MTDDEKPCVGYRNPPEHTRFKKGTSGNPGGRPRKRDDMNTILQRVLNRKIRVKDFDRKMPLRDALIWTLRDLALRGDKQALALQTRILTVAGYDEPEPDPPMDNKALHDLLAKHLGREKLDKGVADE